MKPAIYPGSFDPVTNGHLDLIQRSLDVFEKVVVAIAENPGKEPLFTVEERVALAKECVGGMERVEVVSFPGLLVDFCENAGITVVIRGLRAVSDFEYELQMNQMNRKLNNRIETVFMMPSEEYTFLSSGIIKEVASFGGNISCLVPPPVADALKIKFDGRK